MTEETQAHGKTSICRGPSGEGDASSGCFDGRGEGHGRESIALAGPAADAVQAEHALLHLLRDAPGGQMPAGTLCERLYKECAGTKAVITQGYKGIKNFIASTALKDVVTFVPDEVPADDYVVYRL